MNDQPTPDPVEETVQRPAARASWFERSLELVRRAGTSLWAGARLVGTWLATRVRELWPHLRRAALWTWRSGLPGLRSRVARSVRAVFSHRWTRSGLRITALALLLVALGVGGLWTLGHRVPAGMVGVRQANWGGGGVTQEDYGQGLRWSLPLRDQWHHLDAGTHAAVFAWESEGGNLPMLQVATRDGEAVEVAATVPYRIRAGEAHRLVTAGLQVDYPKRANAILRRVLLEELSNLSAEEFADPSRRGEACTSALLRLQADLGEVHLEPLSVHLGTILFTAPYEKKMLEKQLATQARRTQTSIQARSLQEDVLTDVLASLKAGEDELRAQWETRMDEQRLLDEAEVQALLDAADTTSREVLIAARNQRELDLADGALALQRVEDLQEAWTHEALESEGGRVHLAREAAGNLKISKVTLNSNDPSVPTVLDLDALVALLMGAEDGGL